MGAIYGELAVTRRVLRTGVTEDTYEEGPDDTPVSTFSWRVSGRASFLPSSDSIPPLSRIAHGTQSPSGRSFTGSAWS